MQNYFSKYIKKGDLCKKEAPFMTPIIILMSLAILPVMILATYVYRADKLNKEPPGMLAKAFFMGCLAAFPAIAMESFLTGFFDGVGGNEMGAVGRGLFNGFVVAGFSEELCKLLMLTIAVWRSRHFDEYFDGIVYATFVSLGFAAFENFGYVFGQGTFMAAMMTGTMRAILAVPAHFLFGVSMGYFFALAKFDTHHRLGNLMKALLVPTLLHGSYDALLMIPEEFGEDGGLVTTLLFAAFIFFDIKLWKIGMRRLYHLQELSQENAESGASDNDSSDFSSGNGYGEDGDRFKNFKWDF